MSTVEPPSEWGIAFLVGTVGLLLSAVAAYDPNDDAFGSGRAPVVLAGAAFLATGVLIFLPGLRRAPPLFRSLGLVGLGLMVLVFAANTARVVRLAVAARGPRPPVAFQPPGLTVEPVEVATGEVLLVRTERIFQAPEDYSPFLCLVPRDAPVGHCGNHAYLPRGAVAVRLRAPSYPGEFEVRLHAQLTTVVERVALRVTPGGASPSAGAPAAPGAPAPAASPAASPPNMPSVPSALSASSAPAPSPLLGATAAPPR